MRRSIRDFKRSMDDWGLSPSQLNAMMRLYHNGHCGVTGLSEHLGISNAASSQLIDRLVKLGLLERTEDPSDRRVKQIALSAQGRAMIEKGIETRARWMEELTEALTPGEQAAIIQALKLLTDAARRLN